eukprot:2271111-Pleurochrysis_carterae.AAC.1
MRTGLGGDDRRAQSQPSETLREISSSLHGTAAAALAAALWLAQTRLRGPRESPRPRGNGHAVARSPSSPSFLGYPACNTKNCWTAKKSRRLVSTKGGE